MSAAELLLLPQVAYQLYNTTQTYIFYRMQLSEQNWYMGLWLFDILCSVLNGFSFSVFSLSFGLYTVGKLGMG